MTIGREEAQYALDILKATEIDKTPHGTDPGHDGFESARRNILEMTRAQAMILAQRWMLQRIQLDDVKPSDIAPTPGTAEK